MVERSVGEALELAVVLLGGLVVLRAALGLAARVLVHGTGALASAGSRAVRALRPGLARRLVATVVGVSAPAAAALPPVPASASTVPLAPAHDASGSVPAPPTTGAEPRATYVVRPGDTLWDIARRDLPARASAAQVARAWPRWYAANRGVIGPDPSLIVPGQHLRVPGRRSAGTPTQPHAAPAPTTGTSVPSALSLDPDRR